MLGWQQDDPPDNAGLLYRNYHYRSIATQTPHDTGWALILYTDKNSSPPGIIPPLVVVWIKQHD